MDPIFGKTANPPTIIQNIHVGAGLSGSGLNSMEFPSHPTDDMQHTMYKQGPYPALINKATLGRQHKNPDGTPKVSISFINPTIEGNSALGFGLGQQHIHNPVDIIKSDARITPNGEFAGNSAFFNYGSEETTKTLVDGRNSNIYEHDNVLGKPKFSSDSGVYKIEPLVKNQNHKLPQVKYGQHDIPLFSVGVDFIQRDENASRIAKDDWTKNKHLPDESQTKDFINPVGKLDIDNDITKLIDKTLGLRPQMSINSDIRDVEHSGIRDAEHFETISKKQHFDESFESSGFKSIFDKGIKNLISMTSKFKTQQNTEQFTETKDSEISEDSESFESSEHDKVANSERFNKSSLNDSDELYQELLRSYAVSLNHYLNNSSKYKKWKKNWQILDDNLKKTNLSVKRLDSKDKDVAYTQNKGDIIKFRWRDVDTYIPRSVFAYVLMHELTHQVFPMTFQGHGDPFPDMLCIICVAGYELRIFDLKNIPKKTVYSNGQEITSRGSLTTELLRGIELLREANPNSSDYYDQLEEVIKSESI